jgi:hypothetical protein
MTKINDMKKNKVQHVQSLILTTGLYALLLIQTGCSKECTDVYTLYDTYYNAALFPEDFNTYASENRALYDDDYKSVLKEKINEVNAEISERYEHCDDTFGSGDFWHRCYEDVGAELGGYLGMLTAIKEVTIDGKNYENTDFGAYLILGKQMVGDDEYEYWLGAILPQLQDELVYEVCERKCSLFN